MADWTPTSEPRAGDCWIKHGEFRKVLDVKGDCIRVATFSYEDFDVTQAEWREWSATATRVWPPEQREQDARRAGGVGERGNGT